MSLVQVRPADRRQLRLPWTALISNKAHEFWIKGTGRRIAGQGMIAAAPHEVEAGFGALGASEFAEYNQPQVWVESRQIPSVLHQRVPEKDACVLDLGCGPGTSTAFICHFADPSWTIIGYDFIQAYITEARRKAEAGEFSSRDGVEIRPRFVCQGIDRTLEVEGSPLPGESVDLAIAGGVVGLYMQPDQCSRLVAELYRVVGPGGFIALDAGPSIPERPLRAICEESGFSLVGKAKSFVIEPRPKLVFQRP